MYMAKVGGTHEKVKTAASVIGKLMEAGDLRNLSVLNEWGVEGASEAYNTVLADHVFADLYAAVVDRPGGRAFLSSEQGYLELDLATGISTTISTLYAAGQFGYDAVENRFFILRTIGQVATYDLATGEFISDYY